MRDPFMDNIVDEERETIHIYVVREGSPPVIDAEPEPGPRTSQARRNPWGIAYCAFFGGFFALIPIVAILLASFLPPYDAVQNLTLSLILSLHPRPDQVQLYSLPAIAQEKQKTTPTTGSLQKPATKAVGLITFYNGLFTSQTVPAGTVLTGKDGVSVITSSLALIPAAAPTTPPTYGTVSVAAQSALAGTAGNIAASDIDRTCCGPSLLAQNLNAFSGGSNAQTVPVVMPGDLTNTTAQLQMELDQETRDGVQSELPGGQQLLSPGCMTNTKANHQAGDQALEVTITISVQCHPLAYTLTSVQQQARAVFSRSLAHTYRLVRLSLILGEATGMDVRTGTATLTLHLTAYVQIIRAPSRRS